jgi:hypothetical protein
MLDRALGIAGLALAIIGPVLGVLFPNINKKVAWAAFIVGLLLLGVAGGISFFPNGEAQAPPTGQPPVVNQAPGSAYSYGQKGGITAGTINIAPGRLTFSPDLGRQLLALMPDKVKKVMMTVVGGTSDQAVGDDIYNFLRQNEYQQIDRGSRDVAQFIPPQGAPDGPIYVMNGSNSYWLVVQPSAH